MISVTTKNQSSIKKPWFVGLLLSLSVIVTWLALVPFHPLPTPVQLPLGDGRILQIEGVTYGTEHRMGHGSVLDRFRPWLPDSLRRLLDADGGENVISLDRPGLVVWVNALSAAGQTNVDCQRIKVEFVDKNGDLYGESTRAWFGSPSFWRVGHQFLCYPRDEPELTLRVTTWKEGKSSTTTIPNPHLVQPVEWYGKPLPQSNRIGEWEVRLAGFNVKTNGREEKDYYETAARYFEPVLEIFHHGQPALGWEKPEWFAQDPRGNLGQFLGTHQPALKYTISVYPSATNQNAARLIASLPAIDLTALITNLAWNLTNAVGTNTIVVLGLFPSGTHTFSEGVHEGSSPVVTGPGGGAASGWTWTRRQIDPMRAKETFSHYTPTPVIYMRVQHFEPDAIQGHSAPTLDKNGGRITVRLRDSNERLWMTKPDTMSGGVQPFLIDLPSEVTNAVPEVVLLSPIQTSFPVDMKSVSFPK